MTPNNYINASTISGPLSNDTNLFITTQGPLRITIEAFWRLILNRNIKLIIMLTNLEEDSRKKCDKYWPDDINTPIVFEKFKILLENEEYLLDSSIIQRTLCLHDEETNTKYTITQLQVVCWPDHSVPEQETGFKSIELLNTYVDDFRILHNNSPVLVHCR